MYGGYEFVQQRIRFMADAAHSLGMKFTLWVWGAEFTGYGWVDDTVEYFDYSKYVYSYEDPKALATFEKYYAGQLFENIQKGNLYEGYTQPSNVGNFKRDAFNIVSIAIQNTILPEIVSVQPMSTAAQLLPLLEIRYGATKGAELDCFELLE